MRKKILFAFMAAMISSPYPGVLWASEALTSVGNERPEGISFGDDQGPPPDPLKDIEMAEEAGNEGAASEESNDPLEPINNVIFAFNQIIDGLILRPAAVIYRTVLPEPVRDCVGNVLSNLWEPVSFLNYFLQGNPNEAGVAITRFAINTTIGLVGVIDMATKMDIPGQITGFDDTLSVWGIAPGPYLVIPILGPSTLRGAVGLTADYYADPFNYYFTHKKRKAKRRWLVHTRTGVEMIHQRHRLIDTLDELEENSIDFYAAMRSIHFQRLAYKKQQQKKAIVEVE